MIDIFVTEPIIGGFSSGVNPIMCHNWRVRFHDGTVMVKTYTIGSEPKIGEVTEFGVIVKVEKMPMSIYSVRENHWVFSPVDESN